MKLTIGFSPCPNDTFIFDALVNKKIDTEGIEIETVLEDVQTLNQWAKEERLDISKISYGVLPLVLDQYIVLNSGGALGKGVGPLLISLEEHSKDVRITDQRVAIPGENTTAHMLFSLAHPHASNKEFLIFSAIESAVLNKQSAFGVIIHENRFTYQEKGLKKVIDLGDYWEQQTGLPIPLGGIVVKRAMNTDLAKKLDRLIKKSIEYAFAHYPLVTDYVKQHSQEMSEAVMRQHIDLYVNDFSLELGDKGKQAVEKLLEVYGITNKRRSFEGAVFVA